MFVVRRSSHNPILSPIRQHSWESLATFNWCPVQEEGMIHFFYRAMSLPQPLENGAKVSISVIGHGKSKDGVNIASREVFLSPEEEWEKYGCEDPRVTKLGNRYFIFYTALSKFPFGPEGIKVALAITDDLKTVKERHLVTPFNAKAMALFPEKINGKYTVIFSVDTDKPPAKLAIAQFDNERDIWDAKKWRDIYEHLDEHTIDPRRDNDDHVEVGAPPIKTPYGWVLVYSHINNYFGGGEGPVFGVEVLLLDLKDPKKIIGRTSGPIMTPETAYEKYGPVKDVIFPTGAILRGGNLEIYYGTTDVVGCRAKVNFENLLDAITGKAEKEIKRFSSNPILRPIPEHDWESKYVFNPGAINVDGKIYILYRAMGESGVSTIGMAISNNGSDIIERLSDPVYIPRVGFESKGCEDPRIVQVGTKLHMLYTAYDGVNSPSIAATHISVKDFLTRKWDKWCAPALISRTGVMDKDACVFPRKLGKKGHMVFHRLGDNICVDYVPELDFHKFKLDSCDQLLITRKGMWDWRKVGIAAPPIECDIGYLLFYHGVGFDNIYRTGIALLDKKHPYNLLATTSAPILEPREEYEKIGQMPNVVFPCGAVLLDDTIYIYYGAADSVVGGVKISLSYIKRMFD